MARDGVIIDMVIDQKFKTQMTGIPHQTAEYLASWAIVVRHNLLCRHLAIRRRKKGKNANLYRIVSAISCEFGKGIGYDVRMKNT